uniref:uncharacterized protein LOC120333918 n=1 Tax=Styela clava TaxID=7725 RepID=UPI001939A21E|nr:uncharacterized protein LOC120333918 [Styela clava]
MALNAAHRQNVQIAVTLQDSFMNAVPDYFTMGDNMKLHHDPRKVNVFAHKKFSVKNNLFADSYGEVLDFNTAEEFSNIKTRLLTNPIFLQVRIEKEKTSYSTRYITSGSFIVFINTQHPVIHQQLNEKLQRMQELVNAGRSVALEIRFGDVLEAWFKANFPESWASYSTENSNFCITNFSQRFHECYNPIAWLVCLPCCLLGAPFYCIHRHMKCVDIDCSINAHVQYTAGVNAQERQELVNMLTQAYVNGLNDANRLYVTQPPGNQLQGAPPPYTSFSPQVATKTVV